MPSHADRVRRHYITVNEPSAAEGDTSTADNVGDSSDVEAPEASAGTEPVPEDSDADVSQ